MSFIFEGWRIVSTPTGQGIWNWPPRQAPAQINHLKDESKMKRGTHGEHGTKRAVTERPDVVEEAHRLLSAASEGRLT